MEIEERNMKIIKCHEIGLDVDVNQTYHPFKTNVPIAVQGHVPAHSPAVAIPVRPVTRILYVCCLAVCPMQRAVVCDMLVNEFLAGKTNAQHCYESLTRCPGNNFITI